MFRCTILSDISPLILGISNFTHDSQFYNHFGDFSACENIMNNLSSVALGDLIISALAWRQIYNRKPVLQRGVWNLRDFSRPRVSDKKILLIAIWGRKDLGSKGFRPIGIKSQNISSSAASIFTIVLWICLLWAHQLYGSSSSQEYAFISLSICRTFLYCTYKQWRSQELLCEWAWRNVGGPGGDLLSVGYELKLQLIH